MTRPRIARLALGLILLFVGRVQAQTSTSQNLLDPKLVAAEAAAITVQAYPNADQVLVDEWIRETYAPDGTGESWDDEYLKILTEKGKRLAKTQSLEYALPYEQSEFTRLEIISPDGSVQKVDLNQQSRTMIDTSQMASNIYDPNIKIIQATIPELEIGDILHMVMFRRTLKAQVPNTWSDYELFEYTIPLRHLVYEVSAPLALPLKNIRLRNEIPGTVRFSQTRDSGHIHYRWEVSRVPRMFPEPQMPDLQTVVQRLLVSTVGKWEDISQWYWRLCEPHLLATSAEMEAKVADLTSRAGSRADKIRALFQFVSQKVRYLGITMETEAPGYEPHDVKLTFADRYGVCRDKAALLVAMLRLAKIQAYPVIIMVGPKKDESVPQPYFNHAIVAVEDAPGHYELMDPTNENTKDLLPAYLCNRSYLVARPEGETLRVSPILPAEQNLVRIESQGRVGADNALSLQTTVYFDGINDSSYRGYFASLKPSERRQYIEGILQEAIPGARVVEFQLQPKNLQDTSEPLSARIVTTADGFMLRNHGVAMLKPPILGTSLGVINFILGQTGLKKRAYPLQTEIACGVDETFALDLPVQPGPPLSWPSYHSVQTNKLTASTTLDWQGTRLNGHNRFLLTDVEFTPQDYLQLRRALEEAEYNRRQKPIFRLAGQSSEPDIQVLNEGHAVSLQDANNWTETYTVKKKILSYAGRKANSEIRLEYNPVWSKIILDWARVTTASGQVKEVSSREINVMDADWVGSAPRYPGAKTMVISLPGVEAGSVVEYHISSENHNHPFFSLTQAFADFDPITREQLRISAPVSLLRLDNRLNNAVRFQFSRQGDRETYTWTAEALPVVTAEDSLPPLWSFQPAVLVSTGTWKDLARGVTAVLQRAADQQPATETQADKIIQGKNLPEAQIRAIRDFAAEQLRLAGPAYNLLPLSCITPADQTLREGYGNSADLAVVLFAMLRRCGFFPEFVLASWSSLVPELRTPLLNFPDSNYFNQVLVRIPWKGSYLYLNDTDQYDQLGATHYNHRLGLLPSGETCEITVSPELADRAEDRYRIRIAANGQARITWSKKYFGNEYAAQHKYFSELPPEERKRYYQELAATIAQSAVADGSLETSFQAYPGVREFTVTIPRFAVRSGQYLYFSLPGSLSAYLPPLRSDQRQSPLLSDQEGQAEMDYVIELPSETKSVLLSPGTLQAEAPGRLGRFVCTGGEIPGKIRSLHLTQSFSWQAAVVEPENCPEILHLKSIMDHPDRRTILLELK